MFKRKMPLLLKTINNMSIAPRFCRHLKPITTWSLTRTKSISSFRIVTWAFRSLQITLYWLIKIKQQELGRQPSTPTLWPRSKGWMRTFKMFTSAMDMVMWTTHNKRRIKRSNQRTQVTRALTTLAMMHQWCQWTIWAIYALARIVL